MFNDQFYSYANYQGGVPPYEGDIIECLMPGKQGHLIFGKRYVVSEVVEKTPATRPSLKLIELADKQFFAYRFKLISRNEETQMSVKDKKMFSRLIASVCKDGSYKVFRSGERDYPPIQIDEVGSWRAADAMTSAILWGDLAKPFCVGLEPGTFREISIPSIKCEFKEHPLPKLLKRLDELLGSLPKSMPCCSDISVPSSMFVGIAALFQEVKALETH